MKHIEFMRKYMQLVEEGNKEPWKRFEKYLPHTQQWITMQPAHWFTSDSEEFRCKPRTVDINGFKVPEPVSSPLANGTKYYIASIGYSTKYYNSTWDDDSFDRLCLERGIIHLTREAALIHSEALLSFTKVRNVI